MNKIQDAIRDVWENNPDETYRAEMSHWLGVGKLGGVEGERGFYSIGQNTLADLEQFLQMTKRPMPAEPTVLEWGPGGGSNLVAWRNLAKTYVGVDVSARNLEEANRVLDLQGDATTNFRKVVLKERPTSIVDQLPPADVILSTAVFQHFPSKEYGVEVLKVMSRVAKPGAPALLQIRFDNGAPAFRPKELDEYREKFATATSYPIDEFWRLSEEADFTPHHVRNLNYRNNYVTFYLTKN